MAGLAGLRPEAPLPFQDLVEAAGMSEFPPAAHMKLCTRRLYEQGCVGSARQATHSSQGPRPFHQEIWSPCWALEALGKCGPHIAPISAGRPSTRPQMYLLTSACGSLSEAASRT